MTTEYFKKFNEQFAAMTKTGMAPMAEFQKITTAAVEKATEHHMTQMKSVMNTCMENTKTLSGMKKAEDVASFCTEASKEAGENAKTYTKETMEQLLETTAQYSAWLESGLESFKQNAEKTVKAAKESVKTATAK
jgi:hypothetical protein